MHLFSSAFNGILLSLINLTGDWFISIVLITLGVKILLFPLSIKQQKAMILSQNFSEVSVLLSKKFNKRSDELNHTLAQIITKYRINPLLPIITLAIQTPIFFSLYFSLMNLSTTVGSTLIPWILSASKPDNLHILPVIAGLFQGLSGLTAPVKNLLSLVLPIGIGLIFLWKAPAALSIYWSVNALLSFIEKKIFSIKSFKQRYLNVVSAEEMVSGVS